MSWNPNRADGCVFGMEWAPTRSVDRPVAGVGESSYSWTLDANVTEDIIRLYTYAPNFVANAYDRIDIYEANSLAPLNVERAYYGDISDGTTGLFIRPSGVAFTDDFFTPGTDVMTIVGQSRLTTLGRDWSSLLNQSPFTPGVYAGYYSTSLTAANAFSYPMETLNNEFVGLTPWSIQNYDGVFAPGSLTSTFSQWAFHIDDMETGLSGKRILSMTSYCLCQRTIDPGRRGTEFDRPVRIRPALYVNGFTSWGQAQLMPSDPGIVSYTWYFDPSTELPWSVSALQDFDSDNELLWLMSRPNDPMVIDSVGGAIYEIGTYVEYCDETRVASARRLSGQQDVGWSEWLVRQIATSDPWEKEAGKKYFFNARLNEQQAVDWRPTLSDTGISIRALGDGEGQASGFAEVTGEFLGPLPRGVGDETGYAPAILFEDDTNNLSSEGQPYSEIGGWGGATPNPYFGIIRDPGQPLLIQLLEVDDEPDRVRFYARSENDQIPESNLCVYVRESGTDLSVSSVVQPSDLEYPGMWQMFDLPLTSVGPWGTFPILAEVIIFVSGSGTGWEILSFSGPTYADGALIWATPVQDAGYPSEGTVAPQVTGGGDPFAVSFESTTSLNLGLAPAVPSGLAATVYGWDDVNPSLVNVPMVELSWDGLSGEEDCSEVAYYEIQRLSEITDTDFPVSSDWQTIFKAFVDGSEETYYAYDFEGFRWSPAGAKNSYRIRLVSTTGFSSEWSDVVETVPEEDDRCGYLFTSNEFFLASQWYMDVGDRSYNMLETVNYYEFENRDGAVPVRGLTDRLDEFKLQLMTAADGAIGYLPDISSFDTRGRIRFSRLSVFAGNKLVPLSQQVFGFNHPLRLPYLCVLDDKGNRWFSSVETPTGTEQEPGGRHFYNVNVREISREPHVCNLFSLGEGFEVLLPETLYNIQQIDPDPEVPPLPPIPYEEGS